MQTQRETCRPEKRPQCMERKEVKRSEFKVKWATESFAEEDFGDRGSYMGATLCRTKSLGHEY